MAIAEIQAVQAVGNAAVDATQQTQTHASSFSSMLDQIEQEEVSVQNKVAGFLNGNSDMTVHELMVDVERNRLMLSLTLQVRNKLVEGIQELFRTPI